MPVTVDIFPNFTTAQRTATISVNDVTTKIVQAAAQGTPTQRFTQLLYFNFFGRLPSSAELEFQAAQPLSRTALTVNFVNSDEFNRGGRFVAGLYVGLLDRDAEYGGWLFQRNALATGLVNHDSLVQNFLSSAEYKEKFGTPDDATFVRLLYRYILLREASDGDVMFQVLAMRGYNTAGLNGRVIIARNVLNSEEFRKGTGPRLTAFLLYATLLFRDGSAAETGALATQLKATITIDTIVGAILSSPEFTAVLN